MKEENEGKNKVVLEIDFVDYELQKPNCQLEFSIHLGNVKMPLPYATFSNYFKDICCHLKIDLHFLHINMLVSYQ